MKIFDPYTLYFDTPLYNRITITDANYADFQNMIFYRGNIDAYNPQLKDNTTYKINPINNHTIDRYLEFGGIGNTLLTCTRTGVNSCIYVYYDSEDRVFQKIGQYPSIADFHISQVKKYDKILEKEKLKEFTKAIGLAANGVGIGSFVYLRRIFEGLIEEAHIKARQTESWDDVAYLKERTGERIELLKDFLPNFLVENKSLYGILSKGIHSLDEEECLAYFDTVKVGIELILDEKVDEYKKQKKIEEAKSKIAGLQSKLK